MLRVTSTIEQSENVVTDRLAMSGLVLIKSSWFISTNNTFFHAEIARDRTIVKVRRFSKVLDDISDTNSPKYLSKFVVNHKSRRMPLVAPSRSANAKELGISSRSTVESKVSLHSGARKRYFKTRTCHRKCPATFRSHEDRRQAPNSATTSSSWKRIKAPFVKCSFPLRNGFPRDRQLR